MDIKLSFRTACQQVGKKYGGKSVYSGYQKRRSFEKPKGTRKVQRLFKAGNE